MTPEDVLRYLREHPEFLEAHAGPLAELHIPHPENGRAISIHERQLLSLRERCRELEERLTQWVLTGRANDDRSDRMHRLMLRVLQAPSASRVGALLDGLRIDLEIPWVYLSADNDDELPDARDAPGCGPVPEDDAARLSEHAGQNIASLAWIPLQTNAGYRLLLLGSSDPSRFPADAGTQYLERVGSLLKVLLDGDG